MNYRNVRNFTLGLYTAKEGRGKAPLNSLLEAENVRVHKGEVVPRDGHHYFGDEVNLVSDVNALYQYTREYQPIGGAVAFFSEYIISSGTYLYAWAGPGDDVVWFLNSGFPLGSDDVWIAFYDDWAYIGDGINSVKKYDAVTYCEIGSPRVKPSVSDKGEGVGLPDGYRRYKYRYVRIVAEDLLADPPVVGVWENAPFSETADSPEFNGDTMQVKVYYSHDAYNTDIEVWATLREDEIVDLDGKDFFMLSRISNDAVTWTYVEDTQTDVQLQAGEPDPDDITGAWPIPPIGTSKFIYYKDRLYGVEPANPSVLRYSELGYPDRWTPLTNWLDIRRDDGDVITGLAIRRGSLYIFKNRSIWVLSGDPAAIPQLDCVSGGESVGSQTEIGLGCTASRSLAAYGDDTLIFYSKLYGAYKISGQGIVNISENVTGILGLDDATAGAVWIDADGEPFYILSPPTGNAWVFHIPTGVCVNDTAVNTPCFCVDGGGYLLGGIGGRIQRFYHPDYTDDNGASFMCKIKTAWLNLRKALMHAIVTGLIVQSRDIVDSCTLTLYNEKDQSYTTVFTSEDESVGIDGVAGRLFSALFTWDSGVIESLTYLFRRRRAR